LINLSDLLGDPEQRNDMKEVEQALDSVSGLLGGIIEKGNATNDEVQRQTEQIKNLGNLADSNSNKMKGMGVRMDKQG